MKAILQNTIFLLFVISNQLLGQQINFNGLRILHNTGTRNIFLGENSGVNSISTNTDNVFVGAFTGNSNTPNLGTDNTFIGSIVGTKTREIITRFLVNLAVSKINQVGKTAFLEGCQVIKT